jgi:hypothetical protein
MTVEMNIFKFDGQIGHPEEQEVNMIDTVQADEETEDSTEEEWEVEPQSFEEICEEEIRRFEEEDLFRQQWMRSIEDVFEEKSDRVDDGGSCDEESPGNELWLNDLDVNAHHSVEHPSDCESDHPTQGEWFTHVGPPIYDEDPNERIL